MMEINVKNNSIRLTGKHKKAISIYYSEEKDSFSLSVCQNGMQIGCLPTITFYEDETICLNNLPQGKSIIG